MQQQPVSTNESVRLRRFSEADASALRQKQYPDADIAEIKEMIRAWNAGSYLGNRFDVFAITANGAVVGSVSLYERSKNTVSVGAEVFSDERRRGYAAEGMRRILAIAKERGYRIVQDQVAADNKASIALHETLGFETDGYVYRNAKDRPVLLYLLCL
jgi:RimJ/RimL family protein N-acetyltransferase